ncbi:MAG: ATP-grasp domain-containing protein, partial [Candidatus Omnitrophica bacterium]|nr:ATP-grasp domain-containing protein [Candidatus Omnitrophota bacterium]
VRLCDDKTLFYEFLAANGFGDVTPRTDGAFAIPYLLKKRIDDTGRNSHFILSREREKELLSTVAEQEFFRQEIIPGRFEYASHVLFMGGRIVRSLSFEYEMREDGLVKGQEWPLEQRMIPCPFPDLFARILNAIEFEGLCCIDYKIHEERPYIMEVNPRFGGSLRLYFFSYVRHLQFQPEPVST